MTPETFLSTYHDWRSQELMQGRGIRSIEEFGAAVCSSQEEILDHLRQYVVGVETLQQSRIIH